MPYIILLGLLLKEAYTSSIEILVDLIFYGEKIEEIQQIYLISTAISVLSLLLCLLTL
jgi:hypothetical protein